MKYPRAPPTPKDTKDVMVPLSYLKKVTREEEKEYNKTHPEFAEYVRKFRLSIGHCPECNTTLQSGYCPTCDEMYAHVKKC